MSNSVVIRPNGPLIVRGQVRIEDSDGKILAENNEIYLCRCGHSANKPFCDGAHKQAGFTDLGDFQDEKSELPSATQPLTITVRSSAMLIAKGPMIIKSEDGHYQTSRNKAAFCRCGHSNNKPFCDASHKKFGFS